MTKAYIISGETFLSDLKIYCIQNHYAEPKNVIKYDVVQKGNSFHSIHLKTDGNALPLILRKNWIKSIFACHNPDRIIPKDFNISWMGSKREFDLCLMLLEV